jgi:hypothetical protein
MSIQRYSIDAFLGIDQNLTENRLNPGFTTDCANMDTEDGNLTVGMGYAKHIETKVPGTGTIWRMYHWHTLDKNLFVVCAGDYIYAWNGSAWTQIFDYTSILPSNTHITSTKWDFTECRIGSDDYLLIANGETQIVKWKGTGTAAAFGSGQYVFEGTVASVTYNATKATAASYTESGTVGTFSLTMPAGWSYSANAKVAFKAPCDIGLITSLKVTVGGNTHTLDYVPMIASGDMVVIELLTTTTATAGDELEDALYGIEKITLNTALTADQAARCEVAGIYINEDLLLEVASIDGTKKILTLEEICQDEITVSQTAKVRGGISNIPVNYMEIFVSRLFSAGDASNPSRLYWSQPPGDVRTIEDWSMDIASDQTGGGFVDVGNVNSDPIVAICSLSNQLVIIKESSVFRLLGDRPNNFRVQQINKDTERTVNTSLITNGDIPYWMTRNGIYYHDGQTAHLMPNARQIHKILESVDISSCKACENKERLYFTCKAGNGSYDDSIIVYDMRQRTYMIRNGFNVADICAYDGVLYMINDNRYVYRWDKDAHDYDGDQIDAYWYTPYSDLGAKSVTKTPFILYFRGEGGFMVMDVIRGNMKEQVVRPMSASVGDIIRADIHKDKCRAFQLKIQNQAGSWFRIYGGLEMGYEMEDDGNG